MKIEVIKNSDGTFGLLFGDEEISLSAKDMKALLLEITGVLAPGPEVAKKARVQRQRLCERLKIATNVDLQIFIQAADHDDMVVLLKAVEDDQDIRGKLFGNMSDNSRKMLVEDMEFKFKDDVTDQQVSSALNRLLQFADELRAEGRTDL